MCVCVWVSADLKFCCTILQVMVVVFVQFLGFNTSGCGFLLGYYQLLGNHFCRCVSKRPYAGVFTACKVCESPTSRLYLQLLRPYLQLCSIVLLSIQCQTQTMPACCCNDKAEAECGRSFGDSQDKRVMNCKWVAVKVKKNTQVASCGFFQDFMTCEFI